MQGREVSWPFLAALVDGETMGRNENRRRLTVTSCLVVVSLLFVSCTKVSNNKSAACPPTGCPEQVAKDKAECLKTVGSVWVDEKLECQVAHSLEMCQKAKPDFVWDGMACVSSKDIKNYYRWCIDTTATDSIKATIAIINKNFNGSNCEAISAALESKTEIVFQGEEIVDLTPFQAFKQIKKLDLWNNKITDLSPLAGLNQLEILNLGHNAIVDLSALASLTNLKELYLFENNIVDIKSLGGLKKLKVLDLTTNSISDFSPVDALKIPDLRK